MFNKMFSSSNSSSYGRFASFLSLTCLLIWTSLLVNKGTIIPDIPTNWLMIICIPFGISKTGETINAIYKNPKDSE